jgi:hypothetical protein
MSQKQFKKAIELEIEHLNSLIDKKIIRGVDYREEAIRHRELLRSLKRFNERSMFGFGKVLSFFTS